MMWIPLSIFAIAFVLNGWPNIKIGCKEEHNHFYPNDYFEDEFEESNESQYN